MKAALDQIRDPVGIALAVATAVLAFIFAAKVEHAFAAGFAVLVVRTGAGLLMPTETQTIVSPDVLTDEERAIATLIGEHCTDAEIAQRREMPRKLVTRIAERVQKTLGYDTRKEVEDWALLVGLVRRERAKFAFMYEHWAVKTTLMAGSFIGLAWTLYQISIRIWPNLAPAR